MKFNQHFRSFNEWKWCTIYDCHIFMVYEFLVVLLPLKKKKRKEKKEEGLLVVYLILTFQLWCIKLFDLPKYHFWESRSSIELSRGGCVMCWVRVMSTHEYSIISVNTNPTCLLNGLRFLNFNMTCLLNRLVLSTRLSDFIK